MSKLNWMAIFFTVGGAVLLIFQAVSSMMTTDEIVWKNKSLISIFGEARFTWIEELSWSLGQRAADAIVNMQLWLLMISVGVICFIIGMIFKK